MTLKPGRELDASVAEKVFGCKVIHAVPGVYEFCGCPGHPHAMPTKDGMDIKPYSYRIECAWEVVEKMHKHPKPVLMLAAPQQDYVNEKWRAEFSRKWWSGGDSPYEYAVSADTAPLAICLAALAFLDETAQP